MYVCKKGLGAPRSTESDTQNYGICNHPKLRETGLHDWIFHYAFLYGFNKIFRFLKYEE